MPANGSSYWDKVRRDEEEEERRRERRGGKKRPGLFDLLLEGPDEQPQQAGGQARQDAGDAAVRRIAGPEITADTVSAVYGVLLQQGRPMANVEVAIVSQGEVLETRTDAHGNYGLRPKVGRAKLMVIVPGRGMPVATEIVCFPSDNDLRHELEIDPQTGAAQLHPR